MNNLINRKKILKNSKKVKRIRDRLVFDFSFKFSFNSLYKKCRKECDS